MLARINQKNHQNKLFSDNFLIHYFYGLGLLLLVARITEMIRLKVTKSDPDWKEARKLDESFMKDSLRHDFIMPRGGNVFCLAY